MCKSESVSHLDRNAEGFIEWELRLATKARAERLTFDERHHVVDETGGLTGIVQGKDVWMRQARCDLDLALKALEADGGAKVWPEHLDSDATSMLEVRGHVHGGHPTVAKLALNQIASSNRGAESLEEVSHRREPELRAGYARQGSWDASGQTVLPPPALMKGHRPAEARKVRTCRALEGRLPIRTA